MRKLQELKRSKPNGATLNRLIKGVARSSSWRESNGDQILFMQLCRFQHVFTEPRNGDTSTDANMQQVLAWCRVCGSHRVSQNTSPGVRWSDRGAHKAGWTAEMARVCSHVLDYAQHMRHRSTSGEQKGNGFPPACFYKLAASRWPQERSW